MIARIFKRGIDGRRFRAFDASAGEEAFFAFVEFPTAFVKRLEVGDVVRAII